jgi:hypothetical protein
MSERPEPAGVVARGRVGRRGRSVVRCWSWSGRCRSWFRSGFPSRCRLGVGPGARRRRGRVRRVVGGSLPSVGSTTGIATGTRTGSGCELRMGVPPATTRRSIGLTTTRPRRRSSVRQGYPTSTRSIASDPSRHGLQNCSTSIPSIAWDRPPHVRRPRWQTDDRVARVARNCWNCCRVRMGSPGSRRFARLGSGGSDAPRGRDGLAVATARASGDSRCRLLYWRSAPMWMRAWRLEQSVPLRKTTKSPRAGAQRGPRQ